MPDFGGRQGGPTQTVGPSTATSGGAVLTTGAANVKGSYVQLTSATTYDANWVSVVLGRVSAVSRYVVDIAVGAAASEQVVIPNVVIQPRQLDEPVTGQYLFPVFIPAGSRIAARAQTSSAAGSRTIEVSVVLSSGGIGDSPPFGKVTAHGITTSSATTSTAVDPGGTANTKGSYVELVASTTLDYRWLVIALNGNTQARAATQSWLVDVAVGGSGSEQVILANLPTQSGSTADVPSPGVYLFPVLVPAGSRIAVRAQASVNTATERNIEVAIWGVS